MIESFNGRFKRELIYPRGPRQRQIEVESATLERVDWHDHRRSRSQLLKGRHAYTTPADHEADYYRQHVTANTAATQQEQSLPNPARFAHFGRRNLLRVWARLGRPGTLSGGVYCMQRAFCIAVFGHSVWLRVGKSYGSIAAR